MDEVEWDFEPEKIGYTPKPRMKSVRLPSKSRQRERTDPAEQHRKTDNRNGPFDQGIRPIGLPMPRSDRRKQATRPGRNTSGHGKEASRPHPRATTRPSPQSTRPKPGYSEFKPSLKRRRVEEPVQDGSAGFVAVNHKQSPASSIQSGIQSAPSESTQKKVVRFAGVADKTKVSENQPQAASSKTPKQRPQQSGETNRAKKDSNAAASTAPAAPAAAAPSSEDANMRDQSPVRPEQPASTGKAQDENAAGDNGVQHGEMPQEPAQSSQETVGQAMDGLSLEGDPAPEESELSEIGTAELNAMDPYKENESEEPYSSDMESDYEGESGDDLDQDALLEDEAQEYDRDQNIFYQADSDPDA